MVGASGAGFGKVGVQDAKVAASKAAAVKKGKTGNSAAAAKKIAGGGKVKRKADAASRASVGPPISTPHAQAPALAPAPASELPPSPVPPPPTREPVIGQVRVRYNHYCSKFEVIDGMLDWEKIDEEYAIGFVFKGAFNAKLMPEAPGGGSRPKVLEGAEPLFPMGGRLQRGADEIGELKMVGKFADVSLLDDEGGERIYQLQVEEDEQAEQAARAANGGAGRGYQAANANDPLKGATAASTDLTNQLKSMSVDEIRGQSERYKELVAARDLEDCLYGSG